MSCPNPFLEQFFQDVQHTAESVPNLTRFQVFEDTTSLTILLYCTVWDRLGIQEIKVPNKALSSMIDSMESKLRNHILFTSKEIALSQPTQTPPKEIQCLNKPNLPWSNLQQPHHSPGKLQRGLLPQIKKIPVLSKSQQISSSKGSDNIDPPQATLHRQWTATSCRILHTLLNHTKGATHYPFPLIPPVKLFCRKKC